MNNHNIAIILKEIVRRAMIVIKQERFLKEYIISEKTVDYKTQLDFFTSADKKAQELYLRLLQENFPDYGIIAEEEELLIPCKLADRNLCFFIDPLDGTKAYIRKQSHATSTMLALCDLDNKTFLSCFIGDINTGEIYYFKPDSEKTHRVTEFEKYELLEFPKDKKLSEQYLLLRDDVRKYHSFVQEITNPLTTDFLFNGIEIEGGSIGTMIMRLAKGEVGGVALLSGKTTPWDANPVNGFLNKMGFVMIEVGSFKEVSLLPIVEKTHYDERIIIHKNYLNHFQQLI